MNLLAVVCNGTLSNQNTAKMLVCKLKVSEFQTLFPHPQKESSKVHVMPTHIKLIRNLLADYKTICHVENQILHQIQWKYIEDLNTLQVDCRFHIGQKN